MIVICLNVRNGNAVLKFLMIHACSLSKRIRFGHNPNSSTKRAFNKKEIIVFCSRERIAFFYEKAKKEYLFIKVNCIQMKN